MYKIAILLLSIIFFIYGCDGMYKDEGSARNEIKYNKAPKVIYPCNYKVKPPYTLIQWNDGAYGILYTDQIEDMYKTQPSSNTHEFTNIIKHGTHFADSCSAKQDLQRYLDSRITYKIVK